MSDSGKDPRTWLDEPKNVDKVWWGLCAVCALLLVIDFLVHRHALFSWEAWPGFYAFVGFVAFYAIVVAGKNLRKVLMRDEDYYDR